MFRVAGPMAGMVGMGGTWCSSAMPAVAILGGCGVASTFELGVGRVGKGPIGMGLEGKSF
jgi:hypothetical protein